MADKAAADFGGNQGREFRIGLTQPASQRNTVGYIAEFARAQMVLVGKHALFEDVRMQRRNAVDREGTHNGEVCHAHLPVRHNRQFRDALKVPGKVVPELFAVAFIDFADNHHHARHMRLHQVGRPAFQRLRHDGMVRIGNRLRNDVPRSIPAHALLIHEDTHQFRDRQRGMRVVDVQDIFLRKILQCAIVRLMLGADILNGS